MAGIVTYFPFGTVHWDLVEVIGDGDEILTIVQGWGLVLREPREPATQRTEDEQTRLIGVRDGLIQAIITVSNLRGAISGPGGAYMPPRHHTRKRAAVERRLAELNQVRDALQRNLEAVKSALSN